MALKLEHPLSFITLTPTFWTAEVADPTVRRSVSHYADTWKDLEFTADAIGVDLRTMREPDLHDFLVYGPTPSPTVEKGKVDSLRNDPTGGWMSGRADWNPSPTPYGSASPDDVVALDVYVYMATRLGATPFTPREKAAGR
jgi:hypothetical protein